MEAHGKQYRPKLKVVEEKKEQEQASGPFDDNMNATSSVPNASGFISNSATKPERENRNKVQVLDQDKPIQFQT